MVVSFEQAIIWLKYSFAIIGASLTALLGGWDLALQVLVLFVVLDYITGIAAAFYEKKLSSHVGMWGISKKILLFVPVVLAARLDMVVGSQTILRNLAIWFYMANEGLSILENLGRIGVLVPPPLLSALQQLKKKGESEAE